MEIKPIPLRDAVAERIYACWRDLQGVEAGDDFWPDGDTKSLWMDIADAAIAEVEYGHMIVPQS